MNCDELGGPCKGIGAVIELPLTLGLKGSPPPSRGSGEPQGVVKVCAGRGCDDPHLEVEVKPPLGVPCRAPDTQSVCMNNVGLSDLVVTR